jgi:hypothetical protein
MSNRRATPPPKQFFQMLDDLRIVATIPEATLNQLANALETQTGFLTADTCAELVAELVPDETQGEATFNAIQNLRPEAMEQLITVIGNWRNESDENRKLLSEAEYANIQACLPVLIRDYPALNRMQKAQRLMTVLGNEIKGIGFICDARPVYNQAHDEIEGIVPLTTFKIIYERQNLDTDEIEFVLSETDLDQMIEQANEAKKKLSVLKHRVSSWLPDSNVEMGE